ncbi:unnamed protein product [Mycena citricolor]|uniref:Phospholipase C/P1 nuclease n=2 Tax=Mycena citricolor TaxID=2018698 RepID=A0AAD2HUS2_9AGAR|nr:unnamed protein product [Mycena citricolor]
MHSKLIAAATALAGCATGVVAWGAAGHEIAATIAQIYLDPSVLPTICTLLNSTSTDPTAPLCHLAPVATWADKYRNKMRWSAPLHYIGAKDDYPSRTCAFPGTHGWAGREGGNVLGGIRNVTDILEGVVPYGRRGEMSTQQYELASEALKFLIHFMGDMHMPLHLTGRDRGGNSMKVAFNGRQTNLHSLWDGLLIAKALRSVPRKYNQRLPSRKIESALRGTIYDSYVRMIMVEGVLSQWQRELPDWLACPAQSAPVSLAMPTSLGTFWQQAVYVWERVTRRSSAATDIDDALICPYYWAQPIHALNCELVWPKALDEPPYDTISAAHDGDARTYHGSDAHGRDTLAAELDQVDAAGRFTAGTPSKQHLELDTPEYSGKIMKDRVVEKLLAQAGIRLAGVLNYLFADLDDEEMMVWRSQLRVDL